MSNISFNEFAKRFAEELEIEGSEFISLPLSEISQYDSMGKINIGLLIEELFNYEIDYEVLENEESIKTLYDHCLSKSK